VTTSRLRLGTLLGCAAAALGVEGASATPLAPHAGKARGLLDARAILPANVTAPGPPSGASIGAGPINGVKLPFPRQPVQGFSGVLKDGTNRWLAIPDNGYGRKENSADWLQRIYRVRTQFKRAGGGSGKARVLSYVDLKDPGHKFRFSMVRRDRRFTGADIDPESILRGARGTFWVGDEFGPWMLHFGRTGRLLEPPISLPGVRSPQNPTLGPGDEPTLGRSKGFEAAAPAADGKHAYVFLEGPLLADQDQRRRYVYYFDLQQSRFATRRWAYRAEDPDWLVADAKLLRGRRLLVMERDDFEGAQARFKRVYEVNLAKQQGGFVSKKQIVDLLDLRDPAGISRSSDPGDRGVGNPFSFCLRSVESIFPVGAGRLLVVNDNNYPFDAGRHPGRADGTEWIIVRPG
jgi:glycerophosphoryl diester phosphodiesterase